jgi:hypothetical protein
MLVSLRNGASTAQQSIALQSIDNIRHGTRRHQATLEALVEGPFPVERAGLFLALVAGLQVIRQMVEIPSLAEAEPAILEELLSPIVRLLVEQGSRTAAP